MNTITYLKNQLGYWFLFAMMFAVVACADDKDEETLNAPGKTTFHVEDIVFASTIEGQETTFSFEAGNEWTASFSEGGNVYFSASQTKGGKGKAEITVRPLRTNVEAQIRTAELRISVVGEEKNYVVKISQFGKGANLVVNTENMVLEADRSGEYFADTLVVSSDQIWELTNVADGIFFTLIDEQQSEQITTKKMEVKAFFKDFVSMTLEGGFDIKAGDVLKHITVSATAECKAYQTQEMETEVVGLELVLDPTNSGIYSAPMYIASNVQWKLSLPSWLDAPQSTNMDESGFLTKNPAYVEIRIAEGMIPASATDDVVTLLDINANVLITIPIHFSGIGDDYINHDFAFPRYDKYGNDFSFDPILGTGRVLELPFMIETGRDYSDVAGAPFKLILCKAVNAVLERREVHWAALRMGDSSKNKVQNGVYTKELYLVANERGDVDDVNELTSMGDDREAYLFIVPASVSFDDLFEDPLSNTLKSQYIGSYIAQKNAFIEYKMSVTGIEDGDTITIPSSGEVKKFDMYSDAVKIVTGKLDITEIVEGAENPRTFDPKDVSIDFKKDENSQTVESFILTVGKNKELRNRVVRVDFNAFRGINSEDGSENFFKMFTFYIKQPQ